MQMLCQPVVTRTTRIMPLHIVIQALWWVYFYLVGFILFCMILKYTLKGVDYVNFIVMFESNEDQSIPDDSEWIVYRFEGN